MTLDALRAWLASGLGTDAGTVQAGRALLAQADAGSADALRMIAELKTRETVIVQKYDKTDIAAPGIDGLRPFETVVAEFEDGRHVATTTVREEG